MRSDEPVRSLNPRPSDKVISRGVWGTLVERDDPLGTLVILPPDSQRRPVKRRARWRVPRYVWRTVLRMAWVAGFLPVAVLTCSLCTVTAGLTFVFGSGRAAASVMDFMVDVVDWYQTLGTDD